MKAKRKRWEEWEREYIIKNYGNILIDEMVTHLGVTRDAFYAQIRYLKQKGRIDKGKKSMTIGVFSEKETKKVEARRARRERIDRENKIKLEKERIERAKVRRKRAKEKLEKEMQEIVKKDKENRNYGIRDNLKELSFKKGQVYQVKARIGEGNPISQFFKGKLIKEYEDFILLEGNFKQCFMKADLLIGEYEIKEVS